MSSTKGVNLHTRRRSISTGRTTRRDQIRLLKNLQGAQHNPSLVFISLLFLNCSSCLCCGMLLRGLAVLALESARGCRHLGVGGLIGAGSCAFVASWVPRACCCLGWGWRCLFGLLSLPAASPGCLVNPFEDVTGIVLVLPVAGTGDRRGRSHSVGKCDDQ